MYLTPVHDPYALPSTLPVPTDDGAARHLLGATIPEITLLRTGGGAIALDELCKEPTVLFFYPRTGVPGEPPTRGFGDQDWDEIPGARGCTPQNCGFRDVYGEIVQLGIQLFGVSTQTSDFQLAFKRRNQIAFDYLSDADLALTIALRLPTFEFPVESGGPNRLIKRMSWFVQRGRIEQVWYPVFPPNENGPRVLAWLRERRG
jgi:peroxiredoxin